VAAPGDLRSFVKILEARGQLRRIATPVSRDLEITEIADRVVKRGGPALLFENVEGSSMPVLINAFGSEERMSLALGVKQLDDIAANLRKLLQPDVPAGLVDKLRKLLELKDLAAAAPKHVSSAPCQEIVEPDPSLEMIPALRCWPLDAGRYVTTPLVITRDPTTGRRNVGMYRMQVYGPCEAGMHWQRHKDAAGHWRGADRSGRMEVAVALGADPATTYAATAPLPPEIDELLFAGVLRGQGVELVRCKTVDLEVPANAEIVLEGYVDPSELRPEGPFGDHTGYYSLQDQFPVFHLTALTHRRDPIYQTTIVGRPPMEDYYLGMATERIFLPLLQLVNPEIVDMHMPAEGVFHNLVIVAIRKRFPGHARKVMYALWGTGQMMFARNVVIVDEDVNVHDASEVAWRVTANVDARRDLVIVDGPVDVLDHASPLPAYGGKLGIDATRKGPDEGYTREWPPDITMDPEITALVERRWAEYGLGAP
jgi:4-hydroxy-3-polyprenylbenzoate decarboxylase